MKTKLLSMVAVFMLVFALLPGMAAGEGSKVTLQDVTNKVLGNSVTIAGTTEYSYIIVYVFNPDGTVKFTDEVQRGDNGQFTQTIALSSGDQTGTYKVKAGIGTDFATDSFQVSASGGNNNNPPPPPPPATGNQPQPETGKVALGNDAASVSNGTTADGRQMQVVDVDGDKLVEAVNSLQNAPGGKVISLELKGGEPVSKVQLPANALKRAADTAKDTVVEIKSEGVSYELPVSLFDITALARELNTSEDNLKISLTIEQVSEEDSQSISEQAQGKGMRLLNTPIEFTITIETGGGNSQAVDNFGSTYVTRKFELSAQVNSDTTTGVLIDKQTGAMIFVPTTFETVDGKSVANIKRPGNSVYTVISYEKTFDDIQSHWAKRNIERLASKLVITGVTDTTFAPNSNVSRAEFAAMLIRSLGLSPKTPTDRFTDVPKEKWFADEVEAAFDAGIINGRTATTFDPFAPVTRQEMVKMIGAAVKFAGKEPVATGVNLSAQFKDANQIAKFAEPYVTFAVKEGIVNGKPSNQFDPTGLALRAEAATVILKTLTWLKFINE